MIVNTDSYQAAGMSVHNRPNPQASAYGASSQAQCKPRRDFYGAYWRITGPQPSCLSWLDTLPRLIRPWSSWS